MIDHDGVFEPEAYVDGEPEKHLSCLGRTGSERPVVIALADDRVVCCVYLYDLSADEGEIKRLYVLSIAVSVSDGDSNTHRPR